MKFDKIKFYRWVYNFFCDLVDNILIIFFFIVSPLTPYYFESIGLFDKLPVKFSEWLLLDHNEFIIDVSFIFIIVQLVCAVVLVVFIRFHNLEVFVMNLVFETTMSIMMDDKKCMIECKNFRKNMHKRKICQECQSCEHYKTIQSKVCNKLFGDK